MTDLHGQAILDFYKKDLKGPLVLHNSYDEPEEMSVEVFFREELDLTTIEHLALIECKGRVLDLGAGAGALSLILESRDFEVFALENSAGCVEVMQQSGVSHVIHEDFKSHSGKYDTVLALMNGIGLAGKLEGVPKFLKQCIRLLNQGGQLLIDSSDISYLYEDGLPRPHGYYGEVRYMYEYNGVKGDWFDWIYLDQSKLKEVCEELELKCEILHTDESDQFLASITAL